MQFGAAMPRRRQQIDLNVIPKEFRRRQFPLLTVGLALVLVGAILLLYGLFYLKSYADLEIVAFRARIGPAQEAVRAATVGEEAANQERQRLASQQSDYLVLAERQVRWSDVLEAVSSPPPGVRIREMSQAGYTVSVIGSAPEFGQAVKYLENLRATDLFSNSSIELIDSALLAASTPTPRVSFGTPTPARSTGFPGLTPSPAVPTPSPTVPMVPTGTRTPAATPTATSTPNVRATQTALANFRGTQTAVAKVTATAAARATATAKVLYGPQPTATRTRTPTRTVTPTPITKMTLDIAPAEVSETGGSKSVTGHGPDQAVDGSTDTGWVPMPQTGDTGRWLRVDLRESVWYTPGTDVMVSVRIAPYRHLVSGSLPSTATGEYYVYTYDKSGNRQLLCSRKVSWTQTDTCFSAASSGNVPLKNVAVLDVGIPSSNPSTDANWLQGIAEIIIEVNQRPPAVTSAPPSGPVGVGPAESFATVTVTVLPTASPSPRLATPAPTRTSIPGIQGTVTVGPVRFPSPTPLRPTAPVGPAFTPQPSSSPASQGQVEFLILLEVKPGVGYR